MATAVLVRGGGAFHLTRSTQPTLTLEIGKDVEVVTWLSERDREQCPASVLRWLKAARIAEPVACESAREATSLSAAGVPARLATLAEVRSAREALPPTPIAALRTFQLRLARAQLTVALADPEESLISLAREEERLERALGRETAASEQLLLPELDGPGQRYRDHARGFRAEFERHHALLRAELEDLSARVAPNLTRLLGNPLAARLISTAGGTKSLARMSGARIQLLGSRRRPSPVRGPRYGHLYRAPRLGELPAGRAGAYARSLAALAAIAARADVHTHGDIADRLIARRDRRVRELMGRG
ncbi:MAG: hypothetical protein L3K17_07655 [Thermoplasmata archaeon]|nr:hypothetical protein [Thermoplasmata archaeon]